MGLASSFAVAALASWIYWGLANALITAPACAVGRVRGGRVCGDLSALAGVARFAVLRLVVFARSRSQLASTVRTTRPALATTARAAAPVASVALGHAV